MINLSLEFIKKVLILKTIQYIIKEYIYYNIYIIKE